MDEYYIIAGLGNPGRKYDGSRHNVGFDVIDELVDRFRISGPIRFGRSMIGKGVIGGQKVILMKPLTYMNLSGEAVREVVSYYKADPADHLIVISDDIDLPVGHLRIRKKGSAGGHNGLKNIILHLGGSDFIRIRIGVGGKPDPDADLANHVLGHFTGEDKVVIGEACGKAADAVACILEQGPDRAMNLYNTARKKNKKTKDKDTEAGGTAAEDCTPAEAGSAAEADSAAAGTAGADDTENNGASC
ncbi:MAG: aminoacyl-tRNA hydrolase [Lachnospiraceae bacterium]|nr:aminoacyl-tRNA hydrolase [Lachnospiraceae bacterium]